MVRSALSAAGSLRYGPNPMNGEPTPPPDDPALQLRPGAAAVVTLRPWTPAAAMEPVPPLAPPPARPGAGTPVLAAARAPSQGSPQRALVGLLAVALLVLVVVILVSALGR
jgi:hypothetical protein